MTRLEESRRVADEIRVRFGQAADASNRAVMADTDEASSSAAREAERAMKAVTKSTAVLAGLLEGLSYARESKILKDFDARLARYDELNRRILSLAVENTNLKAQALSFGPASQAANQFRDSLEHWAVTLPPRERCRVDVLVSGAIRDVREIQVLEAPHTAERDDAAMTRMEKEMADADASARSALKSLAELEPAGAPALAEALATLDRFKAVTAQIVALSRRNTNVVALDLSLRHKPALAAACNESLLALHDALANEGPDKLTR